MTDKKINQKTNDKRIDKEAIDELLSKGLYSNSILEFMGHSYTDSTNILNKK